MSTLYKSEPSEIMLCMPPFGFFKTEKNKGDMQMAFAIMRCKKIKTGGGVASALQHCFRERETHNADPEKLTENKHGKGLADNVDTAMGKMRERLPPKRRKDAVLMVEYMMTASPEWFREATKEDQKDFFNSSYNWLCDKYGRENVIVATIHNDETTPHLSAFVTPITKDGRLSAKEFIGNRTKMKNDQTSFAEKVSHLGLKRGIKGSNAKHQSVRRYYEIMNKSLSFESFSAEELKPRKFKGDGLLKYVPFLTFQENHAGVAQRLSKKVRQVYSLAEVTKETVKSVGYLRANAEKAQNEAEKLQKELFKQKLSERGLTKAQLEELELIKASMRQKTKEEQERKRAERFASSRNKGFRR